MIQIGNDKVVLRDFEQGDIEKRIYWETVETEWQQWDAPWEYEGLSQPEKDGALARYIADMQGWAAAYANMADDQKRSGFQICVNEPGREYIGWCCSYLIDADCSYAVSSGRRAVGINIPQRGSRGKGYAFSALRLLIDYLLAHGDQDIYTQTWSGNTRMIALAHKLGFEKYRRKPGHRMVRGQPYDGLTFRLNLQKYRTADRIQIEEIPKSDINTFWTLHWEYLNRDIFTPKDTQEDREYFLSPDYRDTIERFMDRTPDKAHLVYFVRNGTRIGCAQYIIYKSKDGQCFVLDFWVFPAFRGHGTGHRCFEALSQYVKADGALYFQINAMGERARRFWQSLGFLDDGVDEYGDPLMKKV